MRVTPLCTLLLFISTVQSQSIWNISRKVQDIQIDGFIKDWEGVPGIRVDLSNPTIRQIGQFGDNDLSVDLKALWDDENLYVAIDWKDNSWDVERVRRHDAVWITPQKRRRDRMLFFDYLKFHIAEPDYDYIFWLSPRISRQGPFKWHRLLQGLKGMETATDPPLVTARDQGEKATLEILFLWSELKIKPNDRKSIPLRLLFSDSDLPGQFLEGKLEHLKSLEWNGHIRLNR